MRLIVTKELGRLARWLRLFGFDTAYFNSDDMKRLFIRAFTEKRAIITKRRALCSVKTQKVIYVKSDTLKGQIGELQKGIRLNNARLFTRCSECNKEVFSVKKDSVRGIVPPYVFKTQERFFQCPSCAKIFWKATHWDRAREFLNEVRS